MIRPAPLQLKFDNFLPHPVRTPSPPKSKSFISQLYKASWKNPIIALAGLNGLRYAFAVYNALEDAVVDEEEGAENLFKVSLALCAIYLFAFLIEVYGIIGVSIQRLGFIRAYLYLTFLASLLVIGAGVLKGVSYFTFAEELVWECISLASEGRAYEKSIFRGRPWPGSRFAIPERLAKRQCAYAWVQHSWSQVAAVFIFSVLPAVIYYVLVYTYYRQTVDPSHHANLVNNRRRTTTSASVRPQTRGGAGGYVYARVGPHDNESGMTTSRPRQAALTPRQQRAAQQAPYVNPHQRLTRTVVGGGSNNTGSTSRTVTAAAAGTQTKRTFVSRSLKRDRRPPPLMQSPSPVGLTPGPPTYGPSRVYAAFAAPVQYDKFV